MLSPRALAVTLIPVFVLALLSQIYGCSRQDQPQSQPPANKKHPDAPDIAILEIQSLGRTGGDPQGEIRPELMRVKIKNWTTDRTITGVLWEISVYDVDKQQVVEVLTPYTCRDMMAPEVTLKVAPGYLIEIPFYLDRKVHIDGNHTAQIKIKSYSYKKFDPAADKTPPNINYLVAEEWPYKTNTEPVLVKEEH